MESGGEKMPITSKELSERLKRVYPQLILLRKAALLPSDIGKELPNKGERDRSSLNSELTQKNKQ